MQPVRGDTRRPPAGQARADSALTAWTLDGKPFFTLVQKGAFADCCHDHGYLLAAELETGVFPEILDTIAADTDTASDTLDRLVDNLYRAITADVFGACDPAFRQGIDALHDGYAAAMGSAARFDREQVRAACVAIDAGNIATGLVRRLSRWGSASAGGALAYALGAMRRGGPGGDDDLSVVGELFQAIVGRLRLLFDEEQALRDRAPWRRARLATMGCTGFAAGPRLTAEGLALHARTFDGAFFAWNAWPVIALIDERGSVPEARHAFVAAGTAGLVYPGGIGGLNDAGLSCTLHQMSTTRFRTGRRESGFAIAPMVQQRILREASSLDEAVAIARSVSHFGAWTILVSDAKTGQALRIEISADHDPAVATSAPAPWLAQSNHFLADAMAEVMDKASSDERFFANAHFTPTFGKWLETRARKARVEARMTDETGGSNPSLDTDVAINLLADHDDAMIGGGLRSFGRTIVKAYGQMVSIARAAPDRSAPTGDAFWVSLGEVAPGPHSAVVGFAPDWAAGTLAPVAERPVRRAQRLSDARRGALGAYVAAFRTSLRPQDADGRYLGGKPSLDQAARLAEQALAGLDRAIASWEGGEDWALRYARARLLVAWALAAEAARADAAPRWAAAEADLSVLRAMRGGP
ncbi:MAG: carcinine hydrolase/isopenicillin-N N-acyltransferase family protein, partial [Pseudomonadota bacterium]